jgi:hypothetical protein
LKWNDAAGAKMRRAADINAIAAEATAERRRLPSSTWAAGERRFVAAVSAGCPMPSYASIDGMKRRQQKKKALISQGFFLTKLVGVTGFELATPASRTQCSTRLSYTPMLLKRDLVVSLNCKERQL